MTLKLLKCQCLVDFIRGIAPRSLALAILAIETNPILDSRLVAHYRDGRVEGKGTRSQKRTFRRSLP